MANIQPQPTSNKRHSRPTDDDSAAAIGGIARINTAWRAHANEQEEQIAALKEKIAGLEAFIADRTTFDDMEGLTLAQQVPQLQAKVLNLMGKIVGLQDEIARLRTEVQKAHLENHRECREVEKNLAEELEIARSQSGEHSAYQKQLREEIIDLKRKLALKK
jgi:predicted  nucleic acid-binding Zn-ribbon protein